MNCNIENKTDLDSLSENVTAIYLSDFKFTHFTDITRFTYLLILSCSFCILDSLPILPENLQALYCCNNKLTYLPTLPKKLKYLYCENNKLIYLPTLPKNLEVIRCKNNKLTYLPTLPENLIMIILCNNNLVYLPTLPEKLNEISCYNNKLIYIPNIPEHIKKMLYSDEENIPFINTIKHNNLKIVKEKIKILNNFRYLYHFSKLTKWLWKKTMEKIIEPKMMKKYHPNYLIEYLHDDEDIDLDIVLNNW
jgi:hypothetical protein